jgi:hypothetical protein
VGLTPTIETKLESGIYVPSRLAERADPMLGLDQWAQFFDFGGLAYPFWPRQTLLGQRQEWPDYTFEGYVQGIYKANGPIFTCMLVRMLIFSEARFQFRQLNNGRPGELFGTRDLQVLETPWPNGTTGDLLARAIQDADLAGNAFFTRQGGSLNRLRPDWMTIVAGSPREDPGDVKADPFNYAMDTQIIGYMYQPGGPASSRDPVVLLPEEVCHFAPIPDPVYRFRGMSWLTPVIREVLADNAATSHKLKFFEHGACQPLTAKIVTPDGWTTMGDIQVGDRVMGPDGMPHGVVGVYPQGERDVYRLTFSDGAVTECDANHVWRVQKNGDEHVSPGHLERRGVRVDGWRLMTLGNILASGVRYESGPARFRIQLTEPVEYESAETLPVDPYLLGALLGDGHIGLKVATICAGSEDAIEAGALYAAAIPANVEMRLRPETAGNWTSWGFKGPGAPRPNPLVTALRGLELAGLKGHDKFIPEMYMRASVEDRVALLQGLMDTDGTISGIAASYWTTSRQLALQVTELVRGLGGVATICERRRQAWSVRVRRLPEWIIPFRLSRKARRFVSEIGPRRPRHTYLEKVEWVGCKPVQCIKVDSSDELYLTDDFIVTHNTVNMVISLNPSIQEESFRKWIKDFEEQHRGTLNAYKTLYLGGGATVTPVGATPEQIDFKVTQGAGETRVANAAGVPPVVAGFAEGLASATYSNYREAREHFADATMRPLWRNFAGSMQTLVPPPHGSAMLWYDDRDIAFLRADRKDIATIQQTQAATISSLVNAGYKPETVIKAILAEDWALLEHTGLYSVQLQPPMPKGIPASANGKDVVPVPVQS